MKTTELFELKVLVRMEQSDEGHVIRTKIEDASFVDLVHDLRNLPLGVFIHAIKTINDQLTHIYTAA